MLIGFVVWIPFSASQEPHFRTVIVADGFHSDLEVIDVLPKKRPCLRLRESL